MKIGPHTEWFKRFIIISTGIIIAAIWFVSDVSSQSDQTAPKAAETPKLDSLSNEELLKETTTILNEASSKTFARLRALAKSEILLNRARQNTQMPDIPYTKTSSSDIDVDNPVELSKFKADIAQKRLDALKQRLELIETEKTLSDEYIQQIDKALSAVQSLINTIEGLFLHIIETRLRIEDGTLSPSKVPPELDQNQLDAFKQELKERQNELRTKSEDAREALKLTILQVDEIKKQVIEAESALASAQKQYLREMNRRTLQNEYKGQSVEKLIQKIAEAEEEMVLLNGAFNLSYRRFSSSQAKADQILKAIESYPEPQKEDLLQFRAAIHAEVAEKALKTIEKAAAYYDFLIKKTEERASALETLKNLGENLQADATVLSEHIFTLQVLVENLKKMGSSTDLAKIDADVRPEALAEVADHVSRIITETDAAIQKAEKELAEIPVKKTEATKTREKINEQLERIKAAINNAAKARQWTVDIEKLDTAQLISQFQANAQQLVENNKALEKLDEEASQLQAAVDTIHNKIDLLKDPMLRIAQQESLEEKYNISKSLHQIANLKFEFEENEDNGKAKPVLSIKQAEPPEASLSEKWQTLLSTRLGILEEKQKLRSELLTALKKLDQKSKEYETMLSEIDKLTMRHHATALELKKRLGRKQIDKDEIPDGITEALKQSVIDQIKSKSADLINRQILIHQEIETLSKPDETLEKTKKLLTETLASIGKRLDIIKELNKKEETFERKPEQLSETERKKIEHATVRRMEVENTYKEFFLSFFVPSESSNNLTELLQVYYRDVINLEFKQEDLVKRKELLDRLTILAQAEKKAATEMLPLLRKEAEISKIRTEEAWVKIRARFLPEKANELISDFKNRTGRNLEAPPPAPPKQKAEEVQKAIAPLFERHIEQVAAEKWIDIFEKRISSSGIEGEIGQYRDKKGALAAEQLAIQRQMYKLTGHPRSELEKLTPEEKPKSKDAMKRFLVGDIGVLRAERYHIWIQKAIEVVIKMTGIIAIAILAHWLVSFLSNRFKERAIQPDGNKRIGAMIALPLLRTFLKLFIWIVAILAVLNSLGFDIGTILAGFGIGGLAIAMAAKETLSDIIGGVSIYLSKSFKVGDIIVFNGNSSRVEDIGLRYTRLRSNPTKFLITVPNSQLAQQDVVNVTEAPGYFVNINIPLSTRNTQTQIDLALELASNILSDNPDVKFKFAKFGAFGDYSFVISVRYIIQNIPARHTLQSELNRKIVQQFHEKKIEFALMPHADADRLKDHFSDAQALIEANS